MNKSFKLMASGCVILICAIVLAGCGRTEMAARRTGSTVFSAPGNAYKGFMARYFKPMVLPYGFCNRLETVVSCADVHINGTSGMLVPTLGDFHGVAVNGVFNVNLVADANYTEVEVEGDTAILARTTFIVDPDGILHINMERGYHYPEFARANVTIHVPHLDFFGYVGYGHVDLSGLDSPTFVLEGKGGGYITASGVVERMGVHLKGTSGFDGMGMEIGVLHLDTSQYAHAKVQPEDEMTAVTADASRIRYYGHPTAVNVIGLNGGQVLPMEDHYFAPHGLPPYK